MVSTTASTTAAATGAAANGFEIEPAAVSAVAGNFDAEASALTTAAISLQERLTSLGSCWGTDDVGARFGTEYSGAATIVLDNLEAIAVGWVRIAAALRAVAGAHLRGEDDLVTQIRTEVSAVAEAAP